MAPSSKFSIYFVFILMLHTSVCMAQVSMYEKCKSNFLCGNHVNASYPFWGDHHNGDANSRPEYCGLPGYKLVCSDGDVAEITISGESYRVLGIDPGSQFMRIRNREFLDDDDDACPAKYPIKAFDSDLFTVAPDFEQLALYFGCPKFNLPLQFKCEINDTVTPASDAYFWSTMATSAVSFIPDFPSCNKTVMVPVMSEALGGLISNPETLPAVLKQGFNVTYVTAETGNSLDLCLICSGFGGGTCGYNTTSGIPTCFCPDGRTRDACGGSPHAAAEPSQGKLI
ncbi:hypothetical protein MKW92_043315 [Papaver armeniacum]|nr:hypothetical protein MKW92_043315 [Papaver armeniacum]